MISKLKKLILWLLPSSMLLTLAPKKEPTLYLTFDDGPNNSATVKLLDLLLLHQIEASFFCIGKLIEENSSTAKRIVDEGHTLSNHSYHHQQFSSLSLQSQFEEIQKTDKIIENITGQTSKYFRAPQGRWSVRLLWSLWRRGKQSVYWSVDSHDYESRSPEDTLNLFKTNSLKNGDILLFHDDNDFSVEALGELIPKWKKEGFNFSRITDS